MMKVREQHCWQLAVRSFARVITTPSRPLTESSCSASMQHGGQWHGSHLNGRSIVKSVAPSFVLNSISKPRNTGQQMRWKHCDSSFALYSRSESAASLYGSDHAVSSFSGKAAPLGMVTRLYRFFVSQPVTASKSSTRWRTKTPSAFCVKPKPSSVPVAERGEV